MRAASVNPEPGSNSPSKNGGPKDLSLSTQTLRVFPTLQLSKCWLLRPGPAALQGARNLSVGGTGEFYRSAGAVWKRGGQGGGARFQKAAPPPLGRRPAPDLRPTPHAP